ncbi:MAG: hypothetical protein FWG12_06285 [Holophagaceae bacterium]|nr:hypothetical protein [Holophagaceae bacterium]
MGLPLVLKKKPSKDFRVVVGLRASRRLNIGINETTAARQTADLSLSKEASKELVVIKKAKIKIAKNVSAIRTATAVVAGHMSKTVSWLMSMLATVSAISSHKNILHYVRTFSTSQATKLSRQVEVKKPIKIILGVKPKLIRHWGMAFAITATINVVTTAKYLKRLLTARRVLVPMRGTPWNP